MFLIVDLLVNNCSSQTTVGNDSYRSSRREYHAITRGFVAQEVFRRVDPTGRSIGQFLRCLSFGELERWDGVTRLQG